jgi:hypothetical protein
MMPCVANGEIVPPELLKPFTDSTPLLKTPEALRERFSGDGYVFFRGVLPPQVVSEAREEVATRLYEVDELLAPPTRAIASGRSRRTAPDFNRANFWESVSNGTKIRHLSHGPAIRGVLRVLLDSEPLAHDFLYLRAAARGRATGIHYDYPFFGRTSERVVTAWVPVGDVPVSDGPLVIIEGSNKFSDLIAEMRQIDVMRYPNKKAAYDMPAVAFARSRGTHLLTENFKAGDMLVLNMFTAHGSLDNSSSEGRVRLSFDIRYQPSSEPADPRFFGKSPGGTTGAGYAELNGARPLLEEWHVR